MTRIDIDAEIRDHNRWRRQFMNAFAGGSYADMPLSGHRACTLARTLTTSLPLNIDRRDFDQLIAAHNRFHTLADDIIDLSQNGQADAADLLLPQLNDASHHLVAMLDRLREWQKAL